MAKFNKLDVPYQWKDEFTKYPHGYTIFEALCKWVKQVDTMVDNINNWNVYLHTFVETFDLKLQQEVQSIIDRWQREGVLDAIIESVLNTELDSIKASLAQKASQNQIDALEVRMEDVIQSADLDPNKDQEIVDARHGQPTLGSKIGTIDAKLTNIEQGFFKVKNLIIKNSFSLANNTDIGEWEGASGGLNIEAENELRSMSYSDNDGYYLGFKYPLTANVGDILYIYTQVKVKTIEQSLRFGLESDFTASQSQVPTINEFHPISIVKTANIENPYFLLQQRSGGFYTTGEKIYLKYPVVINLTKIYGKGYEPTKEEMDILMNIISKPFDETTNKEIVEWQEKTIRYRYSSDYGRLMKFELGALSVNGINSTTFITTTRARTNLIRVYAGDVIELSSADYAYDVRTFTPSMEYIGQTDYLTDTSYVIEKDGFIRIAIKRLDDGDLTGLLDDIKNSFTILGYSNKPEIPNNLLGQKLEGKTLLNLGDSIAASDLYSGFISTKYSMPLFNLASGGATIAPRAGYDNEVIKQVNDAIAQGVTPDYVLFNGGTNDANVLDLSLTGTITDGYDNVLDLNTFCGAFENLVKTMVNNWHYAKIIYIRTHNMDSRDDRQRVYGELALEICKKWSIPFVDIYSEGRLNSKISVMKTNYAPDGTHPNHEGIAKFYVPLIESKMNEV